MTSRLAGLGCGKRGRRRLSRRIGRCSAGGILRKSGRAVSCGHGHGSKDGKKGSPAPVNQEVRCHRHVRPMLGNSGPRSTKSAPPARTPPSETAGPRESSVPSTPWPEFGLKIGKMHRMLPGPNTGPEPTETAGENVLDRAHDRRRAADARGARPTPRERTLCMHPPGEAHYGFAGAASCLGCALSGAGATDAGAAAGSGSGLSESVWI